MDESHDHLDKNIGKLLRGAKPVEPARPGAQDRIFKNVMHRLDSQQPHQVRSQFWTIAVAAAACIALGALLFSQYLMKNNTPPVVERHSTPQTPVQSPTELAAKNPDVVAPPAAALPQVFQIETADGETKTQALSDGTQLEVAANSRVEILTPDQKTQRPEVRVRAGEVTCDVSKGAGRLLIHSSAGDVLATAAQVKVAVSKHAPDAHKEGDPNLNHNAVVLAAAATKTVMNVAVIRGEAIVREAIGSEKLVTAGETVNVGAQSETQSAVAENWRSGQLLPKLENGLDGQPLEVRRHTVKAQITEQIALVEVDEVFFNPGNQRIEGTFVFPLPHEATICRLAMFVGDNLMEGEIAEAQRARRTFEALKVQRVDPALLEWAGGNTFKMRIFPIEPKSEKRVLISYYEVLKKDHGRINFTYPLASDATQKSAVGQININVSVDSTPDIQSPEVSGYTSAVIKPAPHHLDVSYSANNVTPDKDFSLQYLTGKNAPLVTVPYWHAKRNEGYFVMIFSPDLEQTSSDKHRASDFVFVVDKSGGLGARQLALATRTVKGALGYLTPNDHFSIVAYDAAAKTFQPQLVAATPDNIAAANNWLDGLDAFGASDLTQAWKATAALSVGGPTQVVYAGSGLSTLTSTQSGKLLADADAAFAGKDVRIHCLPLGAVQDLTFLNELAKKYSGTVRPIKDADDATVATSELLEDFSWPLYKNVQLTFDGIATDEVYPLALPNVTAGRQLLVFGKYKNPASGKVKLTAVRDGEPFTQELNVNLGLDASHNFVPKLWATRRIAQLQLDVASAAPENAQNIINDVIETSKRYRVMSEYTSFLVLESAEDYLRYGIERRPDEFDPNANQDVPVEAFAQMNYDANENRKSYKQNSASDRDDTFKYALDADKESLRAKRPEVAKGTYRQEAAQQAQAQNGLFNLTSEREVRRAAAPLAAAAPDANSVSLKSLKVMDEKAAAKDGRYKDAFAGQLQEQQKKALVEGQIDTLAWERQDIFPLIERHELGGWDQHQPHSTADALKILRGLSSQFESLSLTETAYALDKDGKETKQGRERIVVLDRTAHAFASRFAGADSIDLCDGKTYVRLFPQLKYAVRRSATENDQLALGSALPGYLLPWAEQLDKQSLVSVEQENDDGVILRLAPRYNNNRYTLVYLSSKTGPVTKIETYERRRVGNDFKPVKIETLFCEDVQKVGEFSIPAAYRQVAHGEKDTVVSIVRLTDVKANFKPDAELFKTEIGSDWAVRDQDAAPPGSEQRHLSQPLNPAQNFAPRR